MRGSFRDLKGQTFGHLTVIGLAGSDKRHNAVWRCECVCRKTTEVPAYRLTLNRTQSCGCFGRKGS